MTFAHLSDTHLGFRAYGRTTADGFDVRERDVMDTFKRCLASIAECDPDVVIHSGDLFHVVRPSNETIVQTHLAISKFQKERKGKPLILLGGNHDSPRTADSGNILQLFSPIAGVSVVAGRIPERLDFPKLGLEVLCVPSNAVTAKEHVDYRPLRGQPFSILTLHGMAKQALPDHCNFDIEEVHPDRWTYVALGDYHIYQRYGRNTCYPGSTDFTSTNIWEECLAPKGWVWFDTEKAYPELVEIPTRKVFDLDPIDAIDMDGPTIGIAMMEKARWNEDDQPIVRQRILNVHPEVRSQMPQQVVRELNRRALAYRLDVRLVNPLDALAHHQKPGESLEAAWERHIAEASLPTGVECKDSEALGSSLLREVLEREIAPTSA